MADRGVDSAPGDWGPDVLELVYLPWSIELKQYPDGGYFARVVELPGCMTEGDTATEVLAALEEARALWIEAALAGGKKIPDPLAANDYSGKIFVRTSRELHRAVAEAAARDGVSMSQWAGEVLGRAAARADAADSVVVALDEKIQSVLAAQALIGEQLAAAAAALIARQKEDRPEGPPAEQAG
jgi:antitoxin HicB